QDVAASNAGVMCFDGPLLGESGRGRARVGRVLVADCSQDTRVQRVTQRSGWSVEMVRAVIAQQASREARLAVADAVIHNEGIGLDELAMQVETLWEHWCSATL